MNRQQVKYYIISLISVVAGIVLDQFTKFLAVEHLKGKPSFVIIKMYLSLVT